MSDVARDALFKEIVSLRKKLKKLEQDRDYHKSAGERLDASIDDHEADLTDLLDAYEKLGGSPDETIPG